MVSQDLLLMPFVIIVVIIFRFRKIISGGRVSKSRLIGSIAMSLGFSFLAVYSSFQTGVPPEYIVLYVGLFTISVYLSHKFVEKSLVMWKADDGFIHAKGGILSYVVWLASLAARFVIGYAYLGANFLIICGTSKVQTPFVVEVTMIIDLVMMIGVGAVTGRNIRVLSKLKNISNGE